jgi:hypothetical protein
MLLRGLMTAPSFFLKNAGELHFIIVTAPSLDRKKGLLQNTKQKPNNDSKAFLVQSTLV